VVWIGAGVVALCLYGFVATLQADPHFGRILAAYGGATICLVGVAVIVYAPRPS
jgi:small multidrug resistance family-3 protein